MNVVEIQPSKDFLKECFNTDKDLVEKWHIEAPSNSEVCASRTFDDLKNTISFKFYKIESNNDVVGFFGTEGDFAITSFFVKPEYRDKSSLIWDKMREKVKPPFMCGIYKKNLRAAKFLEKMNGKIKVNKDNKLVYVFEV